MLTFVWPAASRISGQRLTTGKAGCPSPGSTLFCGLTARRWVLGSAGHALIGPTCLLQAQLEQLRGAVERSAKDADTIINQRISQLIVEEEFGFSIPQRRPEAKQLPDRPGPTDAPGSRRLVA